MSDLSNPINEAEPTAIEYLTGVLSYMQKGGKLSDIDATVSEALRLHGREMFNEVPGSFKARVLRDSAEEMTRRHNNLNADAVFEDMREQARIAGLNGS